MTKIKLVLDDGKEFIGKAFGSEIPTTGELVFFTGMTGYQEMMTDASYAGKLVVMTYPFIGAYGINRDDFESVSVSVQGLIVKELSDKPVNFRSEECVDTFLKRNHTPGISGIDTRQLTRYIRDNNIKKGQFIAINEVPHQPIATLPTIDLIKQTTTPKPYVIPGRNKRIVVLDLGVKQSIIRELIEQGAHMTVVPYNYAIDEIKALKPDGIIVSNGPGDPNALTEVVKTIKSLLGKFPLLGIGLGHQLIALAIGAKVERLPVGEYGMNIPVKDMLKDKTWITTMSHDFIVSQSTIPANYHITYMGLNNQTIAGLASEDNTVLTVQFHPEGAPGSTEMNSIFDKFIKKMIDQQQNNGGMQHA